MKRHPEECYDRIENMIAHHNDWDTSAQRSESFSSITSSSDLEIVALKAKMAEINKNLMRVLRVNQQVKVVTPNCETCGGPHFYNDCPATVGQTQNVYAAGAYQGGNSYQPQGSGTLPSNTITNPKEDLKRITTRSGTTYQGPTIPTTSLSLPQIETPMLNSEPVVAPIIQPVAATVSALKPNQKPSIPDSPQKVARKTRGPGKFLISCDFPGMDEFLALADLDAIGVAEDVFVKVGTFHFSANFVVVDFDADPQVPLILERSFLKTERALIDVFERELTLRVGKEAITFNLDQTLRYSANYNDISTNRIDVIHMACEEYSQEVLGFSDVIASGNPTTYYDPIVSTSSLTLTPFWNSDFLLEEVNAFLALEDDATSPEELKICKAKTDKSSIDEPPEVELKDLPPHLEYAFLEGDDNLPVIITKDLSDGEKTALITVLKSHKRAIFWKLSDIKGIDLEFCTHKILMEDDFEPVVQHQRRVNLKIHYVIKKEVLKLLDAGLIHPISDSPWIKKRPHSRVLTDRLPTIACLLGYAMHRARSKEKFRKRCEDTNLCLNWEKSHFMVKEGIVLSHKISKNGIEVDKAKVDVIAKLPLPTTVKGILSFLGHAGFYRRFIQDFQR
nr:reverse transcriptase domain-containing protein [Tanacetum cinerariifolium]